MATTHWQATYSWRGHRNWNGAFLQIAATSDSVSAADGSAVQLTLPGNIVEALSSFDTTAAILTMGAILAEISNGSDLASGLLDARNDFPDDVISSDAVIVENAISEILNDLATLADVVAHGSQLYGIAELVGASAVTVGVGQRGFSGRGSVTAASALVIVSALRTLVVNSRIDATTFANATRISRVDPSGVPVEDDEINLSASDAHVDAAVSGGEIVAVSADSVINAAVADGEVLVEVDAGASATST